MSIAHYKRNAAPATRNEYHILINVHHHLSGIGPLHTNRAKLTPRQCLALVTGVGVPLAQKAIRLAIRQEEPKQMTIGRPKLVIDADLGAAIRTFILENNKSGIPVTSALILKELEDSHQISLQERTLQRYLLHLGLTCGKGNHRNIYHDKPAIINYRNLYLERRLENLNSKNHPLVPEVFLDESHCHLDHHTKYTWKPTGGVVNESGRKPMVVIFGAFVVYHNGHQLKGEIVKKSILIWPVTGKARGHQGGRGRRPQDNKDWSTVPEFVRESGIAPDLHDYHGNFNASLFERLFKELCQTLSNDYGPCHIHMDGAKYHVRQENPTPKTDSSLGDIKEWFAVNNLDVPRRPNGRSMTRLDLLDHVKNLNIRPVYASYEIADGHGHTIMKTPPYHCECQPIEMLWGMVKNPIASNPNMNETYLTLRNRLLDGFATVTSDQLVSVWKKTVKICEDYWVLYEKSLEEASINGEDVDDDMVEDEGELFRR